MNKEKLVKCGCGGEAKIYEWTTLDGDGQEIPCWYAYCTNCLIVTDAQFSEADAITAWNRAMGERTAKVKDFGHPCGVYGYCSNCGGYCVNEDPYCPHCGARLEWK